MKRKRQSNLLNFLSLPDYSIPRYFVIDSHITKFQNSKPISAINFQSQITLFTQSNHELVLIAKASSSPEYIPKSSRFNKSHIPLLKSHLQKCLRRARADLAVKTALAIIQTDPIQLLRRLSIIMAEDAIVTYPLLTPTLVWLMVGVSKGYKLTVSDVNWLLGLVHVVALESKIANASFAPLIIEQLNTKRIYDMPEAEKSLFYALGIRHAFGGTRGDVALLANTIKDCRPDDLVYKHVDPISCLAVTAINLEEWELSAIDFHISDVVERWRFVLEERDQDLDGSELQSIMWNCSSGVNARVTANVVFEQFLLWSKYEMQIEEIRREILSEILRK